MTVEIGIFADGIKSFLTINVFSLCRIIYRSFHFLGLFNESSALPKFFFLIPCSIAKFHGIVFGAIGWVRKRPPCIYRRGSDGIFSVTPIRFFKNILTQPIGNTVFMISIFTYMSRTFIGPISCFRYRIIWFKSFIRPQRAMEHHHIVICNTFHRLRNCPSHDG